jgi:23S rRNA (adenine2503-C2)-methyltransferase
MNIHELQALTASLGEPSYRTAQIFEGLHKKRAITYNEMSSLPSAFRARLNDAYPLAETQILEKHTSDAGDACKYLLQVGNGTIIESVLLKYRHGNTLCVSTQAGCRMGCVFCVSTRGGLERNLTAGEICAQVYAAERDARLRVGSVVLMGCGEPLDNFDNTIRFISLITHPDGANLGIRHITLSTCGLVPEMRKLAALNLPVTLAVSLHAPNDELRKRLMPVARKYKINEVLDACRAYADATGRRITIEYTLIDGINDGDNHADELCKILQGLLCHVNLLRLNQAADAFKPSPRMDSFKRRIERAGIPVTARRSVGGDVNAACGQLRGKRINLCAPASGGDE